MIGFLQEEGDAYDCINPAPLGAFSLPLLYCEILLMSTINIPIKHI